MNKIPHIKSVRLPGAGRVPLPDAPLPALQRSRPPAPTGIEPQQHQLLLAVKGVPDGEEPRIAYLAERLQIQHHSAVELVDRMETKGLITRTRGESDRREVHVQLTAQGDRVLTELTRHMRAELRSAAPSLVATLRKLTTRPAPAKGVRKTRLARKRAA